MFKPLIKLNYMPPGGQDSPPGGMLSRVCTPAVTWVMSPLHKETPPILQFARWKNPVMLDGGEGGRRHPTPQQEDAGDTNLS